MIVLDAFAVVAYLRAEPSADEVRQILTQDCSISALNLAEVVDQLVRVFGFDAEDVDGDLATLPFGVLDVDEATAVRAARLRAAHYGSKTCPVSMADCVAAATALTLGAELATSDPDLANVARAHGIPVVALPDSTGRRP